MQRRGFTNSRLFEVVGAVGRFVADYWDSLADVSDLEGELLHKGFSSHEIQAALRWIEQNAFHLNRLLPRGASNTRYRGRALTASEVSKIRPDSHGVLLDCAARGYLGALEFEQMVERAMRSDSEEVAAPEMRRIVALALFRRAQSDFASNVDVPNVVLH